MRGKKHLVWIAKKKRNNCENNEKDKIDRAVHHEMRRFLLYSKNIREEAITAQLILLYYYRSYSYFCGT